jgi:uncharacterized membrane protein YdjX (TVP38/TMEM64 family)
MSQGFYVVIGMSLAYVASFAGLILAYLSYKKRKRQEGKSSR